MVAERSRSRFLSSAKARRYSRQAKEGLAVVGRIVMESLRLVF